MIKKIFRNYYFLLTLSIAYLIAFNIISYTYFIKDFYKLEEEKNEELITLLINEIDTTLDSMGISINDYAKWDDSYDFIQTGNKTFVLKNFRKSVNTLSKLQLDLFMYIDLNSNIKLSRANEKLKNVDLEDFIEASHKNSYKKIFKINDNYYFTIKSKILKGDSTGEVKGYIIGAKQINLEKLEETSLGELYLINYSQKQFKKELKSKYIPTIKIRNKCLDNSFINIISFFDEDNKNIINFKLVNNRDVFNKGRNNIIFFNILISSLFFMLFLLLYSYINYQSKINKELKQRVKDEVKKQQEQQQLLIQQSKLASMGEMIGNIAHQWRQPLNALGLVVQNIQFTYTIGELDDEFMKKSLKKVELLTSNMSKTIDDFRNFFKPNKNKEIFEINSCIYESLNLLNSSLEYHNIHTKVRNNLKDIYSFGFKNEFNQVLLNIINNSRDALIDDKIQEPKIEISIFTQNSFVVIKIQDNAKGISNKILNKIFEPYFTTKEEGKGTGIGLYMSKIIIEKNMKGRIEVKSSKDGTAFEIILPKIEKEEY